MAKELGVDIEQLKGNGPGGRVSEADVRAFVAARDTVQSPTPAPVVLPVPAALPIVPTPSVAPAAPTPVPTAAGSFHWAELSPIQRITGERMRESVVNAPQFALEISADATNLLWLRDALESRITLEARARLSLTGLLVKLVAATLRNHPRANAEFAGGRVKLHDDINVGVAVGTNEGLVVPVIRQTDGKSLAEVTQALATFQEQAKTLHFSADDLAGGTFTISNLGMYGIERFAAIVNPPQSAILAVGAVVKTPVVLANDAVGVRPLLSLTLTIDHRVMDGVQGAAFLAELKEKVEKPYFLI
jgi:pyruvate dehydrogenase E2 component (dihydrolipoamide acetyltransferase)